jgi:hypothetical protein
MTADKYRTPRTDTGQQDAGQAVVPDVDTGEIILRCVREPCGCVRTADGHYIPRTYQRTDLPASVPVSANTDIRTLAVLSDVRGVLLDLSAVLVRLTDVLSALSGQDKADTPTDTSAGVVYWTCPLWDEEIGHPKHNWSMSGTTNYCPGR